LNTEPNQTNCLTEVLFEEAIRRARSLDKYYKLNGKTIGPFHGIPITVKDQFNVKGVDTTIGYVGMAGKPASNDAAVVKILQDLGAIVIAKTNLPQSIMVSSLARILLKIVCSHIPVVRDRKSSLGLDDQSPQPSFYTRRIDGRRRRPLKIAWLSCRLGHGHRGFCPNSKHYKWTLRLET